MAKRKQPYGYPLFDLHNKFQELGTNYVDFICSELNISKQTYYAWKNDPDKCSPAATERVLKIAHDLINDTRLKIAEHFRKFAVEYPTKKKAIN
ncbi:MAG TPA: hypothetical protein VGE79_06390 [Niastella sp.]